MTPASSRFRKALAGALTLPVLAACGTDDAAVLADGSTTTTTAETTTTEATTAETTTAETATGAETAVVPQSAELAVSFSYTAADSGERVLNPYVAVWVEDTDGNLVDTIAVWFLQDDKGTKWLDDLRLWYSASNSADDTTMSGATRSPGSYDLIWDATDLEGNAVAQGDYVVYIEAAREHGPYSIVSAALTLGEDGAVVDLGSDGELVDAVATYLT